MSLCLKKLSRESRYGQGRFPLVRNQWWNGGESVLLSVLCLCKLALFPAWDHGLLMFLDTVILYSLEPSTLLEEQSDLFFKISIYFYLAISAGRQLVVFVCQYSGASFKDGKGFFSQKILGRKARSCFWFLLYEFWQQLAVGLKIMCVSGLLPVTVQNSNIFLYLWGEKNPSPIQKYIQRATFTKTVYQGIGFCRWLWKKFSSSYCIILKLGECKPTPLCNT